MTAVQPGQTYTTNDPRGGPNVRVERVDTTGSAGSGRPSAWVVDALTGARGRWVQLKALHTDGKPRRSGYSLAKEARPAADHPTDEQVAAVMAAIVAPSEKQPKSVAVEFQRAELERTIRRVWPHIVAQARKES